MTKITHISQLDFSKQYSYADYLTWQFTERVELIKGWVYKMTPAPKKVHQSISGNLYGFFWSSFKSSSCKVFAAPFDVRLVKNKGNNNEIDTVVQPDICVICDEHKLDEAGCIGAPDLVIEILSPSTAKKDYNEKYNLYEENLINEYWIVNPDAQTIEIYSLNMQKKYHLVDIFNKNNVKITGNLFPDLIINIKDIFNN